MRQLCNPASIIELKSKSASRPRGQEYAEVECRVTRTSWGWGKAAR